MKLKTIYLFVVIISALLVSSLRADDWVEQYDELLGKYVTSTGVKYRAWHGNSADREALSRVVSSIGNEKLSGKSESEKLAFYLNAYNAWILQRILDTYPTAGPGGGGLIGRGRFFKANNLKVAGNKTSFTALENDVIRTEFNEPRIHFALNCASESCPPLAGSAFRGATLDSVLTTLASNFINRNPKGVAFSGGEARISKIFDWYDSDFQAEGGVLSYINKHRNLKIPNGAKVSFQTYNWSLNEAK
ncbi:MAG: DUF547 domain-containing protein [Verrucomicrobiales bacterium]|nr:DUF547 domain-containing protein [Verrucomicrobiales bacterium]